MRRAARLRRLAMMPPHDARDNVVTPPSCEMSSTPEVHVQCDQWLRNCPYLIISDHGLQWSHYNPFYKVYLRYFRPLRVIQYILFYSNTYISISDTYISISDNVYESLELRKSRRSIQISLPSIL